MTELKIGPSRVFRIDSHHRTNQGTLRLQKYVKQKETCTINLSKRVAAARQGCQVKPNTSSDGT
jgi:hypothetical protein